MLVEVALTPGVFDPGLRPGEEDNFAGQLRVLGRALIRDAHGQDGALCIANLCDGAWLSRVRELATRCQDPKLGPLLRSLCQIIMRCVLSRPYTGNLPNSDHDWAEEAVACHNQQSPFAKIATSSDCDLSVLNSVAVICNLAGVVQEDFTDSIRSDVYPPAYIEAQVDVLRPLLRRADWLALVLPDVRTGTDDETNFLIGCARAYQAERAPFGPAWMRVVSRASRTKRPGSDLDYSVLAARQINGIKSILSSEVQAERLTFDVVMDHTVLNRFLIAGTGIGAGRKGRWAIDLGHPARWTEAEAKKRAAREKRSIPKENWRLLAASRVAELFDLYCV